jgi:serine/threonine protein kinase
MSTAQFSVWTDLQSPLSSAQPDHPTRPVSSVALDLFAAVCSTRFEILLHSSEFRANPSTGIGAISVVEHGAFNRAGSASDSDSQIIAVKQARKRVPATARDHHITHQEYSYHLCMELRILSHTVVRQHPNIIDILGIGLQENLPLSVVLEYSPYGTLREFLLDKSSLSIAEKSDYASQVGRALEALHSVGICHGDVKTDNALAFHKEDAWIIKVSDFSHAVLANSQDPSGAVDYPIGTPLLNAPEIRTRSAMNGQCFDISNAMLTDVFSFGLLVWEILKGGYSFFESSWIASSLGNTGSEEMLAYLNHLPQNGLQAKGLDYLKSINIEENLKQRFANCIEASLLDYPKQRKPMAEIRRLLGANEVQAEYVFETAFS